MTSNRTYRWWHAAALAAVGLAVSLTAFAIEGDTVEVSPEHLLKNPQNFWARSIFFRDTLLSHPGGRRVKIGKNLYAPFNSKVLKTCYADPDLVDRLQDLPLNKEYIFSGTLLSRPPGFLRRIRYYFIVRQVTATIEVRKQDVENLIDVPMTSSNAPPESAGSLTPLMREILQASQGAVLALAEESGVTMAEALQKDSPYQDKVRQRIHEVLRAASRQTGLPATVIASEFIKYLLESKYVGPVTAETLRKQAALSEGSVPAAATPETKAREEGVPVPPGTAAEEESEADIVVRKAPESKPGKTVTREMEVPLAAPAVEEASPVAAEEPAAEIAAPSVEETPIAAPTLGMRTETTAAEEKESAAPEPLVAEPAAPQPQPTVEIPLLKASPFNLRMGPPPTEESAPAAPAEKPSKKKTPAAKLPPPVRVTVPEPQAPPSTVAVETMEKAPELPVEPLPPPPKAEEEDYDAPVGR